MRSNEIIEIIADVVRETSKGCTIVVPDYRNGGITEMQCPTINYVFGNTNYVKTRLDELSSTAQGMDRKYPLIALFCPFNEQRNTPDYYTKAKVRVLIACPSDHQWSNEQRLETSFKSILRPIYKSFITALLKDKRFDFGYDRHVKHEYSENYSYGKYGALTETGEKVSDFIDAINISNLELTVKNLTCR